MATRIQIQGVRRAATLTQALAEDLRRLREDAGISQRALARASGVPQSVISRVEAGLEVPSVETYARLGSALGADLAMRLYPNTGPAIRDRHQARMAEALISCLGGAWKPWPEVGVTQPVRGWIDLVLVDKVAGLAVASELESTPRRLEQVIRWSRAKADALRSSRSWPFGAEIDLGVDRLLVVRDTRANRDVANEFQALLHAAYPADPWQSLSSLKGEATWPGSALLWAVDRRDGAIELSPTAARPRRRDASARDAPSEEAA